MIEYSLTQEEVAAFAEARTATHKYTIWQRVCERLSIDIGSIMAIRSSDGHYINHFFAKPLEEKRKNMTEQWKVWCVDRDKTEEESRTYQGTLESAAEEFFEEEMSAYNDSGQEILQLRNLNTRKVYGAQVTPRIEVTYEVDGLGEEDDQS